MKKTILTLIIAIIGLLVSNQVAFAASAVLSAQPLSASSTVGSDFNLSVQIDPVGNSVCVIKGTINFDGLSCQSITLADGLMTQTVPTCTAPSFNIGIPKCSSVPKNLFSISVKGTEVGQENLSFSAVKIIGVGVDVAFNLQPNVYDIIAAPKLEDKISPVITILGANPMFVTVGETYTELGATAIDNVDGDISSSIKIEGEVDTLVIKSYQVTYSAIDSAGNKSSVKRTVVVSPVRSTETDSVGLEVPSGVGELDPINIEGDISTTSSSSVATTTENEDNTLVATAVEAFSSISNKLIAGITAVLFMIMLGLYFYNKRKGKYDLDTPDIPTGL